jgi:hypothetical protein
VIVFMDAQLVTIIVALIGLAGTYLGAKYGTQYQKVKSGLSQTEGLLNAVNEAAKDDSVTEAEFQAIVDAALKIKG